MNRTLFIECHHNKGQVEFSGAPVQDWGVEDRIKSVDLASVNSLAGNLQHDLAQLRLKLQKRLIWGHTEEDLRGVGKSLNTFLLAGHGFWRALLGNSPQRLLDLLHEAATRDLPNKWWLLDPQELSRRVLYIEVKGSRNALLPMDILPIGNPELSLDNIKGSDLFQIASLFGGFSSIVRYVSYGTEPGRENGTRVLGRSALPPPSAADPGSVVYFRSEDALYFDRMHSYLKEEGWRTLGPYPRRGTLDRGTHIAYCLLNPDAIAVDDSRRGVLPGIAHIHAHANTRPGLGKQLIVVFSYDSECFELTSTDIENAITIVERNPPGTSGLLVVFSACYALGGLGSNLVSTAFNLAEAGCRAVVGPRDAIPASVAYTFSRILYRGLARKEAIGRIVVESRWKLLKKFGNPLGILYSVFGETSALTQSGRPG
jgi:hypothetical protein